MFKHFFGLQSSYTKREVTNKKIPQTIVFQTQNTEKKVGRKILSVFEVIDFFLHFSENKAIVLTTRQWYPH